MTAPAAGDVIIRIAARGDGVSASGQHRAFAVPGDVIAPDGTLIEGAGHRVPPCRHFPECGGCQLQHLTDAAYADYCASRIAGALAQHGLTTDIRRAHLSPPRTRRRAALRALRAGGRVLIGFNAAKSHNVVDMLECHVLDPRLLALVAPLRKLLGTMMGPKRGSADVQLTLTDQGVDVALKGVSTDGIEAVEALTAFCERHQLARLTIDEGYGPEPRYEPKRVTISLSGHPVAFPSGAFLQATADGEAALVAAVREAVGAAKRPIDLFAGLGTFALALDGEVTAAEAARDAVLALMATRRVAAVHRDLYRRPFASAELDAHDAIVLDPPRSGALEQVRQIAASAVPRVAYVSCNPATFARDAELLVAGGYRLGWVRPVGQFRWSTHVELAGAFSR
ncbi:MAG TPA: class I SAM-dependent RNA methyltransferase [Sphingomicrobium sp.]|nr:class I SAM-dependent RNA methyltransferase [Sphingomicrobium sp.]